MYIDGIDPLDMWKYLQRVMKKEGGHLLPSENKMVGLYREVYRRYWGFSAIQQLYGQYPTYMIWDDHEIVDGYGSYFLSEEKDEIDLILPSSENSPELTRDDRFTLFERMVNAGKKVYREYQHSHNPQTDSDVYDYSFEKGCAAFYVLDGRGHRDINRNTFRILGKEQLERFERWLERVGDESGQFDFIFVQAGVPMFNLHPDIANLSESGLLQGTTVEDDLRDHWVNRFHDVERKRVLKALFEAAGKGKRVVVLSGDVHVAAAFQISDENSNVIYQLTTSGITYGLEPIAGWILSAATIPDGKTVDGHDVKRLGFWFARNYGVVHVNSNSKTVDFSVYQKESRTEETVFCDVIHLDFQQS